MDPQLIEALIVLCATSIAILTRWLWLRVAIILAMVVGCAGAIWGIVAFERQQRLLNPWPPLRRRPDLQAQRQGP